ncbi:Gldg family protein [Robertkochia solimangrovi]|uniref:Gldg family protein n=1 Tax=Robertkochia solimangrovi TaxID=2213046 RepID=UPI0013A57680|nr:Gldg family protein [Robertkochia solimangrovi]
MELQKMFYSPIAWLVLAVFSIQAGIQLMQLTNDAVMNTELGYTIRNLTRMIYTEQSGVMNRMQNYLYLYIPLLTMGLFSHEFSSGSIKLLYSAPVSNRQIVLGKYLSMVIFGLSMSGILVIISIFGVFTIKDFDLPLVLTAILGLFLVVCAYSAIGLFVSSLTSYQIVAAIGTFAILFVLGEIGNLWQDVEFVRDITYWLSINGRSDTMIRGLIGSEDVLYFILVSGLFITFTIFRLKGIRERSPKYISFIRYAGAFMLISFVGYLSTLPTLMYYYDTTRTKTNTLTLNSQQVLADLKGKVKIDTYVNIFDNSFWSGAPANQKFDMSRYDQYRRFYPDIDLSYNYYYALPQGEEVLQSHNKRFEGLSTEEALTKASNLAEVDPEIFKPADYYADEIDLASEQNRFVSKITTEAGNSTPLRVYDDMFRFPNESQITAAFKKLTTELPRVGFVTGHQERDVNDFGSRGYLMLANEKSFRYALINNGFEFQELELAVPVDEQIDILIIADVKKEFSAQELQNLNAYIEAGGNLVIAADLNRQQMMNPLVAPFGVSFLPGQIVEYNEGYGMDLVTSEVTDKGKELAYLFTSINDKQPVMMPGALAISYKPKSEFKYISVLESDAKREGIDEVGSWNELNTSNFIDETAKLDTAIGEIEGPHTTALALTRNLGDREQRIMILGDADFISNGELSVTREGYRAQNFAMGTGMFFWLSNGEVPIDVRRPELTDDRIYLEKKDMPFVKILYRLIIPLLFAITFLIIWLRRKGR